MQGKSKQGSGSRPNRDRRRPENRTSKAKQKKSQSLDPNLLIKQVSDHDFVPEKHLGDKPFSAFGLNDKILANLTKLGFEFPTIIQEESFDEVKAGGDVIGIASTGTGKTGAFLLPLLDAHATATKPRTNLVIVPTRELALQVQDELNKFSKGLGVTSNCFIGGTNLDQDMRKARQKVDFIIGTPGRLLDLIRQNCLKLHLVETLILDEFDKMFDMGFIQDLRAITRTMNNRKQTILFSATKNPKQQAIISEFVLDPFIVEVSSGKDSSANVNQEIIRVQQGEDKFNLLVKLLNEKEEDKVILFTETKHLADRIAKKLNRSEIAADQIHGNKSQNYRIHALNRFKSGSVRVLVATDVAARGIDINDVGLVINYQLPKDYETYVHRVGRTGRAGKTGMAYTFVEDSE